jgi:hypothetical protein
MADTFTTSTLVAAKLTDPHNGAAVILLSNYGHQFDSIRITVPTYDDLFTAAEEALADAGWRMSRGWSSPTGHGWIAFVTAAEEAGRG